MKSMLTDVLANIDYNYKETISLAIIFIIMGVLKLMSVVSKSKSKVNIKQKVNIFYTNTAAGWGIFSGVTAWNEWFGQWPQVVFTIMTVVFVGFNILLKLEENNVFQDIIMYITKKK